MSSQVKIGPDDAAILGVLAEFPRLEPQKREELIQALPPAVQPVGREIVKVQEADPAKAAGIRNQVSFAAQAFLEAVGK